MTCILDTIKGRTKLDVQEYILGIARRAEREDPSWRKGVHAPPQPPEARPIEGRPAPSKKGKPGTPVIALLPDGREEFYPSIVIAAYALNVGGTSIHHCITGKNHQCAGRKWRRASLPSSAGGVER